MVRTKSTFCGRHAKQNLSALPYAATGRQRIWNCSTSSNERDNQGLSTFPRVCHLPTHPHLFETPIDAAVHLAQQLIFQQHLAGTKGGDAPSLLPVEEPAAKHVAAKPAKQCVDAGRNRVGGRAGLVLCLGPKPRVFLAARPVVGCVFERV